MEGTTPSPQPHRSALGTQRWLPSRAGFPPFWVPDPQPLFTKGFFSWRDYYLYEPFLVPFGLKLPWYVILTEGVL